MTYFAWLSNFLNVFELARGAVLTMSSLSPYSADWSIALLATSHGSLTMRACPERRMRQRLRSIRLGGSCPAVVLFLSRSDRSGPV
jgi:hypothetical protein